MSNLIFLAVAFGVFVVGGALVLLVNKSRTGGSSPVDQFRNEMGAIAPKRFDDPSQRRR